MCWAFDVESIRLVTEPHVALSNPSHPSRVAPCIDRPSRFFFHVLVRGPTRRMQTQPETTKSAPGVESSRGRRVWSDAAHLPFRSCLD